MPTHAHDVDGIPIVSGDYVERVRDTSYPFFREHGHGPFLVLRTIENGSLQIEGDPVTNNFWNSENFQIVPKTSKTKYKSSGFKKFQRNLK